MIKLYSVFVESVEMTAGNTTGAGGDASPMGGQGYQRSGGLNGEFGNTFTPKSQSRTGTYKHRKIKKRRFIKNINIK